MCRVLLKRWFEWLYTTGMFLLVGGGMALMFAMIVFASKKLHNPGLSVFALVCGGVALGLGIGALFLKRWLWSNYDPNRRVPEQQRMKESQDRAMTSAEFKRRYPDTDAFEAEQ